MYTIFLTNCVRNRCCFGIGNRVSCCVVGISRDSIARSSNVVSFGVSEVLLAVVFSTFLSFVVCPGPEVVNSKLRRITCSNF